MKWERELRIIFGFFGIISKETIVIENLDVIGVDVQGKIEE